VICLAFTPLQMNEGSVVAVGPGRRTVNGDLIPVGVKQGDKVLLPEYGGVQVKLGESNGSGKEEPEYVMMRDHLQLFVCAADSFPSLREWRFEVMISIRDCLLCRYYLYRDEEILGVLTE
jgi:hypothetical protein